MRCEVCGREILGPPQRRVIEGAKLTVCGKMRPVRVIRVGDQAGQHQQEPQAEDRRLPQAAPRPRVRNDVESVEQLELVEDYGTQIRKARQKLGLSEKDLAKKMQEKESVVKNLEKQELTPD